MLVKHTIEEEVSAITYTLSAECICDRCNRKFWKESESQEKEFEDEEEEEFLKNDFSICSECRRYITTIQQRQMSLV